MVLAASGGEPFAPVQLQKAVFLLSRALRAITGEQLYRFSVGPYGQYDAAVYRDVETLQRQGLVVSERRLRREIYAATTSGIERAGRFVSQVPASLLEAVRRDVRWVLELSFRELVRAV